MNVQIIGVPFQGDVARWGGAKAAQGFLDAGLVAALGARGHTVSGPIWIELPREERSRDTVSNLGRIAARTGQAVATALRQPNTLPLVLAGDCTHSVGPVGGLAFRRNALTSLLGAAPRCGIVADHREDATVQYEIIVIDAAS